MSTGWRFACVFAFAILSSLGVLVIGLGMTGASARGPRSGSGIVQVSSTQELLGEWRDSGVHGALLVDVTRDLGYAPVATAPLVDTKVAPGWPVPRRELSGFFLRSADRSSAIWAAAKTGMVRSVVYVLPPDEFAYRVQTGRELGYPGIAEDGRSITANDEGYLRYISDSAPGEPAPMAVLNVDASYFESGTVETFMRQFGSNVEDYRLITLNRSEDATGLSEAARSRLDRAARWLRQELER